MSRSIDVDDCFGEIPAPEAHELDMPHMLQRIMERIVALE